MNENKFDFFASFVNFLQEIFTRMKELGASFNNDELINSGRSDAEKETIKEVCDELDTQCELMKDLEGSGKDPKSWYQEKSAELLKNCDDETFAEIKKLDAEISRAQLQSDLIILDNLADKAGQISGDKKTNKDGGK